MTPFVDKAAEVQRLVKVLTDQGKSPGEIAELVGVGVRTVYRWKKGDTGPQNDVLMRNLEELAVEGAR